MGSMERITVLTMALKRHMKLQCHPLYGDGATWLWPEDNMGRPMLKDSWTLGLQPMGPRAWQGETNRSLSLLVWEPCLVRVSCLEVRLEKYKGTRFEYPPTPVECFQGPWGHCNLCHCPCDR